MQGKKQQGFSLVELSIVLVVVGLLLGTTIAGLSDFIWHARNAQAKKDLMLIEEALLGYVISNGGLPCPDTDGFQGNPGTPDGVPNIAGSDCDNVFGYLPWTDLGLRSKDPWDNLYLYRIDSDYSKPQQPIVDQNVTFTLTESDGNIVIRDAAGGSIIANNIAAVFFSVGPNGHMTEAEASNDEDENLNGTLEFVDKAYVPPGAADPEFDDVMHWLSSFTLKNRMAQAQRLP
jgi:prepilin-type N-terminal cleavage/methylation domain-containing protein